MTASLAAPSLPPGLLGLTAAPPLSLHCQVTPFLLERIRALTGGKSLDSNIKLVKNNARVCVHGTSSGCCAWN